MSKRDRKHKQRPASANIQADIQANIQANNEDDRQIKRYYQYYQDAEYNTEDEYYTGRSLTEKERRVTQYVYDQSNRQRDTDRETPRGSIKRYQSKPTPVKYMQKSRNVRSAQSGNHGEYYNYDDMSDEEFSHVSQPVLVRERGRDSLRRRPHSSHAGERVVYTYNDGKSVISEDMVSKMSNVVIKDRVIEKPIYIDHPKQYRNVGVQMTTNYIAQEVKPPKKLVRNVATQTPPPPPPPRKPSPPPREPTPPPSEPPPPTPRIEIVQVKRKPEPIYVTVPVKEEPVYFPVEKKEPEPVIVPINMEKTERQPVIIPVGLRRKEKPVLVRVGGGWVTKDYYRNKYYPLRVVELDGRDNKLKDKYLFVKSSGSRRKRCLDDLSYQMYRERPKALPDYPF